MEIKTLTIEEFDAFTKSQPHSQFLQSSAWQVLDHGDWVLLGVMADFGEILAVCAFKGQSLFARFKYIYAPRGPVVKEDLDSREKKSVLEFLLESLKKKNPMTCFLRLEPVIRTKDFRQITAGVAGWRESIALQPAQTLILDLALSEDELLASFHQKTRYNIRLAQKKGLQVIFDDSRYNEKFLDLMEQTGERDSFKIHSRAHYRRLLADRSGLLRLGVAVYHGRVLAAGLFAAYGDTFTYVHGASSNEERQLMAPYTLQWEAIRLAKRSSYRFYDFFGIDEKKWPGVTRFKLGFGGETLVYAGTNDYVLRPVIYNFYKMLRKLRRRF
jgi:lipid II:glycine glycyltransferase (peptidoglycan interpeptide bridge formation enzyme)